MDKNLEKYKGYNKPYAGLVSEHIVEPFAKTVIMESLSGINGRKWIVSDLLKDRDDEYLDKINKTVHTDFSLRIENPENLLESYICDIDFKMNDGDSLMISPATQSVLEDKIERFNKHTYLRFPYIATITERYPGKWHLYMVGYNELKEHIHDNRVKLDKFIEIANSSLQDKSENILAGCYYCNWDNNPVYDNCMLNVKCKWFSEIYSDYYRQCLDKRNKVDDYFENYAKFILYTEDRMFNDI